MKYNSKTIAQSDNRALADISRSRYVVIATKTVHQLQIRPMMHNQGHPYHSLKSHPGPAVVWECVEGQTDTQTCVTSIHFASSNTTQAKCNKRQPHVCDTGTRKSKQNAEKSARLNSLERQLVDERNGRKQS